MSADDHCRQVSQEWAAVMAADIHAQTPYTHTQKDTKEQKTWMGTGKLRLKTEFATCIIMETAGLDQKKKNKKQEISSSPEREQRVPLCVYMYCAYQYFSIGSTNNSITATVSMCLCVYWLTCFYTCVKVNV